MSSPRAALFAAAAGLLFGLGLAVSGMADPDKVLGFLDPLGAWDPSLALVMGGALAVSIPGFALVRRRGRAVCGPLQLPAAKSVDRDLLLGAVLFGVGWGLAGYCPGPAIAGLGRLATESLLVVPVMFLGFWIADRLKR
jgi:uncharacterized membrane protein YedE/YeeE